MGEDEAALRLRRHFEVLGTDAADSSIYADDGVLEFVHTGERIRGRAAIEAVRLAYPGRPARFEVHRVACTDTFGVVEMTLRFDGDDPHPIAAVVDLVDGEITCERRYIAEPDAPAPYRAPWAQPDTA